MEGVRIEIRANQYRLAPELDSSDGGAEDKLEKNELLSIEAGIPRA